METLNYKPIADAIKEALATISLPTQVETSQELSMGYLATNCFHIEILDLGENDDPNSLDSVTLALRDAVLRAIAEQGYTTKINSIHDSQDNLLLEIYDDEDQLWGLIHLTLWDLEYAITTTQYYL